MLIKCEFSGGLETLFDNQKTLSVEINEGSNIQDLLNILRNSHLKKTPELFVTTDNRIRAGVLVLINDDDWELHGCEDYMLENKDSIAFVSTLHGG